ncbi:MAG: hypothetical protein JJU00_20340 [Opitutales bacterium]|nr:hypothetical protein [Opitutales bacterium]
MEYSPQSSKNLVVVVNPTQLLNALEAQTDLNLKNALIVVSHRSPPYPKERFLPIMKVYNVGEKSVLWCPEPAPPKHFGGPLIVVWKRVLDWMRIRNILKSVGQCEFTTICLASIHTPWALGLTKRLKFKQLVSIDDGTAISTVSQLRRGKERSLDNCNLRTKITQKSLGKIEKIYFFTTCKEEFGPNDVVIKNNQTTLRKLAKNTEIDDRLFWFIGQPIVEGKLMTEETYYKIMRIIVSMLPNKVKKTYVLHPRESAKYVNCLVADGLFTECIRLDVPVEIGIALRNRAPAHVGGFFSTGLENIAGMLGQKIRVYAYRIEPEDWLGRHDFIEGVLNGWKGDHENKIKVVDLRDNH